MHINPNINILNFLKQVQKCSAEVLFETSEGDRIALKSTLSQYIFFTIASNPELLQKNKRVPVHGFRTRNPHGIQMPQSRSAPDGHQ